MSNDVILKATDLSLGYGQRTVLGGLSLEIHQGEMWFCLGPNGEGKSTFLKAILGDLRPQAGQLWLHPDHAGRTHIGVVPQRCDLNPSLPMTVREFVLLGTVGTSLRYKEYPERLAWALGRVGLEQMARRNYWALSGGQRQRALVARALIRKPNLLLLDEPTNGLDLPTADMLMRLLTTLNRRDRITILFVTHDVALAARYATHAILLRDSHVMAGPMTEVLTRSHLTRTYGVEVDVSRDADGMTTVHVAAPGDTL